VGKLFVGKCTLFYKRRCIYAFKTIRPNSIPIFCLFGRRLNHQVEEKNTSVFFFFFFFFFQGRGRRFPNFINVRIARWALAHVHNQGSQSCNSYLFTVFLYGVLPTSLSPFAKKCFSWPRIMFVFVQRTIFYLYAYLPPDLTILELDSHK
jgi:hypothetical protein